ncbi:glycoside hydrolase family 65 protein [Sphingomonas profundi]|uniref:glycoside hydrolase family 65 protein n=1 Tax=Alterirhizorhabdus profundi TaxID=2681549 RepID=UPI0012E93A82|nr:glycosyl hydrolase family 65 protein [Sphingomonas profundi]
MARLAERDERRVRGDGWTVVIDDRAPDAWAATILALSNGQVGIRGVAEHVARGEGAAFLAGMYETVPIHYHERLSGFARSTDTRVPVADGLAIDIAVDGVPLSGAPGASESSLDLRRGLVTRTAQWTVGGRAVTVTAERVVPFDRAATVALRLSVTAEGAREIAFTSRLVVAAQAQGQGDDPRIGVDLGAGGIDITDSGPHHLIQRTRASGRQIAIAQAHSPAGEASDSRPVERIGIAGARATLTKAFAYAEDPAAAEDAARAAVATGFDALVEGQERALAAFWRVVDLELPDVHAEQALRLNLFHLFQAASRDGAGSVAAKGLTGEGYEGHYFWDTEAFVLPVLAFTAPALAREMLRYRFNTLDAARANARALNHEHGALYAWRTIGGGECSAHYPSGSAQYHINAAIAFAIGIYHAATGDDAFMAEMGAEMLVETARIWLQIGHHDARRGGFSIQGVTGPDEYTALIDNNWYTNRMAQKHLRLAVRTAASLAARDDAGWRALSQRLALSVEEIAGWALAADAMLLPYDEALGVDAQDDSFLAKPRWDVAGTPADRLPLLLHNHPLTLYRHQVAKQADLVLGMVLGGEEIDRDRKRRNFDYYSGVTIHDSTLSAGSFAILAAEVGAGEDAWRFFRETLFVDLDDLHGNTDHGAHMAAMANSWLALAWGYGGLRVSDGQLRLAPTRPAAWNGYRFGILWRGTRLSVAVDRDGVTYRAAGGGIAFAHRGTPVSLDAGGEAKFA